MTTELTPTQRSLLLSEILTTVRTKFYDPHLHDTDLDSLFETCRRDLLACPTRTFAREVETTLAGLRATPVKFYHRSQQLVPSRWAIRSTFRRYQDGNHAVCMFQDVLPGGPAHAAG